MYKKRRWLGLCVYIVVFAVGCQSPTSQALPSTITTPPSETSLLRQYHQRDSVIQLLQAGDIVLRLGNDLTSYMLSQLNQDDQSFSHCGVVSIENGKPYIYHAIGGDYNPNQKIKRESPTTWLAPQSNRAIGIARLQLSPMQRQSLQDITQQYYREGRIFDLDFDLETDDKLYCAEMIYKALRTCTTDSNFISTAHRFGRTYVGVDNIYHHPNAMLVCKLQY